MGKKKHPEIEKLAQPKAAREAVQAVKPGKPVRARDVEILMNDHHRAKKKSELAKKVGDRESDSSALGTIKAELAAFSVAAQRAAGSSKGGKGKRGHRGPLLQSIDEFLRAHPSGAPDEYLEDLRDNEDRYADAFESLSSPTNFQGYVDFEKQILEYRSRDAQGRILKNRKISFARLRITFYEAKR